MKRMFFLAICCVLVLSCNKDDDAVNPNCAEPEAINIVQLNSTSILFDWGTAGETAWEIEYGPTGFTIGSGTIIQTSQLDYFIDGLMPATSYEIYLRANCGSNGFSSYISLQFVTLEATASCNTPTDLVLIDLGNDFITIGWSENNETAWEVQHGAQGFPLGTGTVNATSQSNYRIEGLAPATTYEIYVRANCGTDGFSVYSEAIVITTNQ